MKKLEDFAAAVFGIAFLVLAFAVALETGMRKVFNKSLQGVDEMGGYILACGAALAIAVALVSRAHIRIDLVHDFLPRALRVLLNVVAMIALTVSAALLTWMAWIALDESWQFSSTAQTPWATPLVYPQTIWVASLAIVVVVALFQLARIAGLIGQGRADALDLVYGPRGAKEELQDELDDLKQRQEAAGETGAKA